MNAFQTSSPNRNTSDENHLSVSIAPLGIIRRLWWLLGLLILADICGQISTHFLGHSRLLGLIPMFQMDQEQNVPTMFSTLMLIGCSVLTFTQGLAARPPASGRWYWWGLAALFLFLSCDEFFQLHEELIGPVRTALDTSGPLLFAWVIPYGLGVLVLGAIYLRFFMRMERGLRLRLMFAAGVYLCGALGMEMAGGAYYNGVPEFRDFNYGMITMVEETLEMTGLLLALRAFALGFGVQTLGFAARLAPPAVAGGGREFVTGDEAVAAVGGATG